MWKRVSEIKPQGHQQSEERSKRGPSYYRIPFVLVQAYHFCRAGVPNHVLLLSRDPFSPQDIVFSL